MPPDRPRLLLIGDFSASRLGNRSVAEELRDRLASAGWQVTAASDAAGALGRALGMLAAVRRLRRRIDVVSIDLFSGRAFWWAEAVSRLARRYGLPQVLVLHGGGLPAYARRHPTRVGRLLARADRRIAPSAYLAEALGTAERPVEVIPNPLPIADYDFRPRRSVRADLVWLRSLAALYNPQMALRTLARVRSGHPDATLTLYGPDRRDGTAGELREIARREGLGAAVRLAGPVPKREVPERLARHDIFLNTSWVDNVPISVLEAMATGLPVVSTAVGGIPHLLEDGRTALLVDADDDRAMAEAVSRLLAEPDLAARLSRTGREAVERFDWDEVLPAWKRLFSELRRVSPGGAPLGGRERPSGGERPMTR